MRPRLAALEERRADARGIAAARRRRGRGAGSPDSRSRCALSWLTARNVSGKEFAFRLAQAVRDLETSAAPIWCASSRTSVSSKGSTGEQVQGQHEMMNYLRRVSSSPRP